MGSVAAGLFFPIVLALLFPALLVRGDWTRINWRIENTFLLLASCWAAIVIGIRGAPNSTGTLPYFAFLWTLPHILAAYKPDESTVRRFGSMLVALFAADLTFNLYTLASGADLLGRSLDIREGVVVGRLGGLFAHSFYSGAISIAAMLTLLPLKRVAWLCLLPATNLVLAGSWRFTAAIAITMAFALAWRRRTRSFELFLVAAISLLLILGVVVTSGFVESGVKINPSNTFRVFAWLTSIDRLVDSPWIGVGYPNDNALRDAGVSFASMEGYLIAESWYLGSAITFGVPYTLFFLGSFLIAFEGRFFGARDLTRSIIYPFILTDLTYGSFFGSVLIYSWLWILITSSSLPRHRSASSWTTAQQAFIDKPSYARW
ncbi:MAG: O-antigen ligase family protein [Myxococcales bacterium]|nr:O-antigen ligase family protein [Myxococcales bacterium]